VEQPKPEHAPRTLMQRIRLRVMAVLVGTVLAAVATVSLTSIPAWPIVGVAVATVALAANKISARLRSPVCWGCGKDLGGRKSGEYGIICPDCGTMTPEAVIAASKREGPPRSA